MVTVLKLKKDSVIVIKTRTTLTEDKAEMVMKDLKRVFPDNEVLLPNGAEIIILEKE